MNKVHPAPSTSFSIPLDDLQPTQHVPQAVNHPTSHAHKLVFPYHKYQALGSAQLTLGVLAMATGCYDITLYLHPEWYHRSCDNRQCGNHSVVYQWVPWSSLKMSVWYAWLVPSWPVLVGAMVVLSGCVGTCTCLSEFTSQNCVRRWFLVLSLLNAVLFVPSALLLSVYQAKQASQLHLHLLQVLVPSVSCALCVLAEMVCVATVVLCCCATKTDPQVPYLEEVLLLCDELDERLLAPVLQRLLHPTGTSKHLPGAGAYPGSTWDYEYKVLYCEEVISVQSQLLTEETILTTPHDGLHIEANTSSEEFRSLGVQDRATCDIPSHSPVFRFSLEDVDETTGPTSSG